MDNQTYSTTQASNIVAIAGVVVLVLKQFHVQVGSDEVATLLGALITAAGIIWNFVHRYKQGGVTPLGFKKPGA